jgi:hypothetical protein
MILSTISVAIPASVTVGAIAVTVAVGPVPIYLIASAFEPIFEIVEQVTIRGKTHRRNQGTGQ